MPVIPDMWAGITPQNSGDLRHVHCSCLVHQETTYTYTEIVLASRRLQSCLVHQETPELSCLFHVHCSCLVHQETTYTYTEVVLVSRRLQSCLVHQETPELSCLFQETPDMWAGVVLVTPDTWAGVTTMFQETSDICSKVVLVLEYTRVWQLSVYNCRILFI